MSSSHESWRISQVERSKPLLSPGGRRGAWFRAKAACGLSGFFAGLPARPLLEEFGGGDETTSLVMFFEG